MDFLYFWKLGLHYYPVLLVVTFNKKNNYLQGWKYLPFRMMSDLLTIEYLGGINSGPVTCVIVFTKPYFYRSTLPLPLGKGFPRY